MRELAEYRTVAERRDFGETARHLLRRGHPAEGLHCAADLLKRGGGRYWV